MNIAIMTLMMNVIFEVSYKINHTGQSSKQLSTVSGNKNAYAKCENAV